MLRDDPELLLEPRAVGGEEAGAVFERPLIFLDIFWWQLTPIRVVVAHKKLRRNLASLVHRVLGTRGHEESAELELAGLAELAKQEVNANLQELGGGRGGIRLKAMPGLVKGGQELLVARHTRIGFEM